MYGADSQGHLVSGPIQQVERGRLLAILAKLRFCVCASIRIDTWAEAKPNPRPELEVVTALNRVRRKLTPEVANKLIICFRNKLSFGRQELRQDSSRVPGSAFERSIRDHAQKWCWSILSC